MDHGRADGRVRLEGELLDLLVPREAGIVDAPRGARRSRSSHSAITSSARKRGVTRTRRAVPTPPRARAIAQAGQSRHEVINGHLRARATIRSPASQRQQKRAE